LHVSGILVVGSSLITRLKSFARRRDLVWQLPIPVELRGRPGLRLRQLRPLLEATIVHTVPAYLVLHLGANDIGDLRTKEWIKELEIAILFIRAKWPGTIIIWSDMLPRQQWRYCRSVSGAENARKRNQRRAHGLVQEEGGVAIKHEALEADPDLAPDGVHLSDEGQQKLFDSLQQGLQTIVGDLTN
jgi:lysophospholipase L1-like esterase